MAVIAASFIALCPAGLGWKTLCQESGGHIPSVEMLPEAFGTEASSDL